MFLAYLLENALLILGLVNESWEKVSEEICQRDKKETKTENIELKELKEI